MGKGGVVGRRSPEYYPLPFSMLNALLRWIAEAMLPREFCAVIS
jgi:hypothetical protein